jgi:L-cysteine desulfhydrase
MKATVSRLATPTKRTLRQIQRRQKHVTVNFETDFSHHLDGVARLNNGSFGASPNPVLNIQRKFHNDFLSQPDALYFDPNQGLDQKLQEVQEKLSKYLHTRPESTCILENATVAVSTICQHWGHEIAIRNDNRQGNNTNILLLNFAYGAVVHAVHHYCTRYGNANIVFVDIPFPVNESGVLEALEKSLVEHRPRYAMLDHISSQPAIVFPIKDMVSLCREYGVEEIAIDGAHSVGSLDMSDIGTNISELGCDYYFSNLHKWAFCPPAATVLWVSDRLGECISHAVVSWNYGNGLAAESRWPGTRDFSSFMAAPAAIQYLEKWRAPDGSGRTSIEYNKDECWRHAKMLADAFCTELPVPAEMCASMTMVQCPPNLVVNDKPGVPTTGIRSTLRNEYQIECAIGAFENAAYIRLSHHVYNCEEEFSRLRDAILDLAK